MAQGDIHTTYRDGRWVNSVEGGQRASNAWPNKEDAVAEGRNMAISRGVEHFIHNMDGTISGRNTYPRSRDPRTSRG
jgi:hypothetical protein